MAKVKSYKINTELTVSLNLSESEVRALDGIFGYDIEKFLEVFYERMGRLYVQRHEDGVRSLHKTIRKILSEPINKLDNIHKKLNDR